MSRADVVVVGGGVIGCAVARALARAGVGAMVLERDEPGTHASWAAAGMLSPLAEADGAGPFLRLLRESRRLYPRFVEELEAEAGMGVEYRDEGTLLVSLREADDADLEERYRWQTAAGLPVERLSASETRALEPALSSAVRWALRFPEDHQVENRLLARALWLAAVRAGAEVRTGAEVREIVGAGGRVRGVALASGERVEADAVVVAAGCWAGRLGGLPSPPPVEPVHGQLVAIEAPGSLRHVVDSERAYLVPRSDGRILVGATMESTGFRRAVTAAGVLALLAGALEIAPGLRDAPIVEHWSGLRPGTPDGLPILGPDPGLDGLFYAAGHFRNGILLTPITAEIIRDLVLRGASDRDLAPYSILRF
ncbi:MAG TPA: glycine oxidase ThiO [Longimicrobiaceae bacterium]|nr:glycine oxidase ThiO [Longimicrobiaceae bacterium]